MTGMKSLALLALVAGLGLAGCDDDSPGKAEPAARPEVAKEPTGLASCDAYLAAVETYLACDQVPQAERDTVRDGADALRLSWKTAASLPDDRKAAAETSCKDAEASLRATLARAGC